MELENIEQEEIILNRKLKGTIDIDSDKVDFMILLETSVEGSTVYPKDYQKIYVKSESLLWQDKVNEVINSNTKYFDILLNEEEITELFAIVNGEVENVVMYYNGDIYEMSKARFDEDGNLIVDDKIVISLHHLFDKDNNPLYKLVEIDEKTMIVNNNVTIPSGHVLLYEDTPFYKLSLLITNATEYLRDFDYSIDETMEEHTKFMARVKEIGELSNACEKVLEDGKKIYIFRGNTCYYIDWETVKNLVERFSLELQNLNMNQ